jgi:CHAT domain-containing protein
VLPFHRSRGVVAAVASALAVAAALVLVVRLQPVWWQAMWGPAVDPRFEKLVAAVGDERYIEGRLSGGFRYGPLRPVTRGPVEADQNLALLSAAAEFQKLAQDDPKPENLHGWGIAQALMGRRDDSAKTLHAAIEAGTREAAWYSDAAAIHLANAAEGRAEELPIALELATQALSLQPNLAEASFNRALSLERLSLSSAAIEEWQHYLTLEREPTWRQEAESHITALTQKLAPRPSSGLPATLEQLTRLDRPSIERLVDESPGDARVLIEGVYLVEALTAESKSTLVEAAQPLWMAARLEALTGDRLSTQAWMHARTAANRAVLRQGLSEFLAARGLLTSNDMSAARAKFEAADRLLKQAGSPLAAWSTVFAGQSAFNLGETNTALAMLSPASQAAVASGHLAVAGRARYFIGLAQLRLGQHAAVATTEREAATLAQQARDRVIEASARSEVADALWRLALPADAWRERAVVLQISETIQNFPIRHIVTIAASRAAAHESWLSAASAFAAATLENAERWNNVAAQAEARVRLADVLTRQGRPDSALQMLTDADQLLSRLPDSDFADGWRADLEVARGTAALATSPVDALTAADHALAIIQRHESPFRLARAKWLRGKSLSTTDPSRARTEFKEGLRISDAAPTDIDPFGRSLAEERWLSLRDLLALPSASPTLEDGLDEVLAVLLGRASSSVLGLLKSRLQPLDVLLVPVALDQALVIWRITAAHVDMITRPISRAELTRLVMWHAESMENPRSSNWRAPNEQLSQLLLGPATDMVGGRLLLATDSLLSRVAFAALTMPGSNRAVAEVTDLVVLAWLDPRPAVHRVSSSGARALIVGDPETPNEVRSWPPLPAARREAEQVGALYPDASVLIGADATRASFVRALPSADIVHFAGHALGNRTDPSNSRLLLSGPAAEAELTAADVAKLHLRSRVVVLGSCESAVPAKAGEGPIYGLARAFLQAGVKDVVATRWSVDDESAGEFFANVHRLLASGLPPAPAVRRAQLELRGDGRYAHPYYWAGYGVYSATVTGEAR